MSEATSNTPLHERIYYQALTLGGFVAIAVALLVFVDGVTREPIAQRNAEDMAASLAQVVPNDIHDNVLLDNTVTVTGTNGEETIVYRGTLQGQITALVWETTAYGYAGEINEIIAVDPQGKILGTRVLHHKETPGLGDKIEEAKDDWILQFSGLSLGSPNVDQWKVKKDGGQFDQFSGATITPRAVVKSLREALEFFRDNRDAMLGNPS